MHWIASFIATLAVLGAAPAQAQTYPTKPIHILVPYAPGGITDIAARIVGAKLTEAWGQQVVVENKPGGNGFIGMTAGAKAAPDGYTLTMATVGDIAINPALFKKMPYDIAARFRPDRAGERCADGARRQRQHALQDRGRCDRRRQGAARAGSRSARRATAASTRSCSSGWRSTPAPSSSTFPTRAARRRRRRSPAATFRSRSWQVRRSRRTSRAAARGCWR